MGCLHKGLAIIDKVIDRLSRGSLLISAAMILIMVFATTYGVIRRYAFNSPDQYSYEISMIFLLLSFCSPHHPWRGSTSTYGWTLSVNACPRKPSTYFCRLSLPSWPLLS